MEGFHPLKSDIFTDHLLNNCLFHFHSAPWSFIPALILVSEQEHGVKWVTYY